MLTKWEREELGRLTHQKIQAYSEKIEERTRQSGFQPGRMTVQNLQSMKNVQKQTDTKAAKVKLLIERLKMTVATALSGLISPSAQRVKEDQCKVYGHNLPWGTTWKGEFPKCLDCKAAITDAAQLRGAVPMEERLKFRSYGEK